LRLRRTTIQDVAVRAGVGKVTVSYVLNGRADTARISPATAAKVLRAADELGYRPNALARMLATRRTDTIAVVYQYGGLFGAQSAFISEVMRGVCTAAVRLGYDLMLHTKPVENPDAEADVLTDGRVDGVLILRDPEDPTLARLVDRGFPCVQFFTQSDHPGAYWVDCDNFLGGRLAAEHLSASGCRRLACFHGPMGSASSRDRLGGFLDACDQRGSDVRPEHVRLISNTDAQHKELKDLFGGSSRPDGVFVWSDDVAVMLLEFLRAQGIRVPDEVAVVGFDSLDICNRSVPTLTSVAQPVEAIAQSAMEMLAQKISGAEPEDRHRLFTPTLEPRGSTRGD